MNFECWGVFMAKIKTIRLHPDTHKRLKEYGKTGESFDELVNRILDVYDVNKGKSTNTKQKSPHEIIKELNTLEDDLVDAVNGLRKTYESDADWKKDFGRFLTTFEDALKFDWANAQIQQSQRLKPYPKLSKLLKLRLKWIEQILNIIWQITKLTK